MFCFGLGDNILLVFTVPLYDLHSYTQILTPGAFLYSMCYTIKGKVFLTLTFSQKESNSGTEGLWRYGPMSGGNGPGSALLENLPDDAITQLYVTKLSTISLHFTKLYTSQIALQQRHQSRTAKSAKTFLRVHGWCLGTNGVQMMAQQVGCMCMQPAVILYKMPFQWEVLFCLALRIVRCIRID